MAIEGVQSDNDFVYLGTDIINENGAYKNYYLKGAFGYLLNSNNQLKIIESKYIQQHSNLARAALPSGAGIRHVSATVRPPLSLEVHREA